MEGLIAIAIIWFVFSRLKKSTGKKAQPAKKPVAPPPLQRTQRDDQRTISDPVPHDAPEGSSLLDDQGCIGGSIPHVDHEGVSRWDEQGCIGGSIPHVDHEGTGWWDEQGCIGGSIPHDTHEGSAASVQSRSRPKEIERPGSISHKGYALTPAGMRSAVIMAEILSRPVSMRRNGRTIR